jgi:hypothetical protein
MPVTGRASLFFFFSLYKCFFPLRYVGVHYIPETSIVLDTTSSGLASEINISISYNRGSVVDIAIGYGLDDRGVGVQFNAIYRFVTMAY